MLSKHRLDLILHIFVHVFDILRIYACFLKINILQLFFYFYKNVQLATIIIHTCTQICSGDYYLIFIFWKEKFERDVIVNFNYR